MVWGSSLLPPGPFPFTVPDSSASTSISDSVPDIIVTEDTFIELKVSAKARSGIDESPCTR